jgi:HlyD family secretion protein
MEKCRRLSVGQTFLSAKGRGGHAAAQPSRDFVTTEASRHRRDVADRNVCPALCARFLQVLSILVLVTLLCGCGEAPRVEVVTPKRGVIQESFSEPARTRLARTWPVAMPVTGRIARIELEPGDHVTSGKVLVGFDRVPFETAVAEAKAAVEDLEAQLRLNAYDALEKTALIEAIALVAATTETLRAADAQVEAEQARSERNSRELERIQELAAVQTVSQTALDDAKLAAETSLIELKRQEFIRAALNAMAVAARLGPEYIEKWLGRKGLQRESIVHLLAQSRERLARAQHDLDLATIKSPINGVVLERYEQGDSTLSAGQPLLLLGNMDELEVIADVLTQDALRLSTGTAVKLQPAARMDAFDGKVKRIDPAGFTKLSSLGVEQQRVNVIVDLVDPPPGLGVGYRVQAQFLTARRTDALIVPRFSVLQAPDQSFYVFKVAGGRLARQPVDLGLRNDLELEVVEGLTEQDRIVSTPDTTMKDGAKVKTEEKGEE